MFQIRPNTPSISKVAPGKNESVLALELEWLKDIQMNPSVNCWIPNSKRIIAKGHSVDALVCLSVATPISHNVMPAMKLAEAEKHDRYLLLLESCSF